MPEPRTARLIVREKQTGRVVTQHTAQIVPGVTRNLPRRGTAELLQVYSQSPVLQAVVRKIASSMAAVRWIAHVKAPNGDLIPAPGHIAERLINSGVPGLDGVQCRMLETTHLELVGESGAILERNFMGVPDRRWPIPPNWIRNVPAPSDDMFEIQPPGGSPFTVMRQDFLWHKDADPYDPYRRGVGVARSLADEINADEAAAKHIGSSLTNRARPDIIVSGSKEVPLRQEDALRLNEVWTQRFSGPENVGKPFVSAAPITVETLTPSFRELTLKDMREFERDIIVTVFGVPPGILGIMQDVNRAAIDAAAEHYAKYVLRPRLESRKAVYNEQLAWQYDDRLVIDYEDPVEENREFKLSVIAARPQAFTDDEVRAVANEAPLPDGEGDTRPPPSGQNIAPDPAGSVSRSPRRPGRVNKISAMDIDDMIAAIDHDLMVNVLRSNATAAVAEFGSDALDDISARISFDLASPATESFISRTAGERSNLINGTTEKLLRRELSEGVAAGEAQLSLIERVLGVVTDASIARADTIARTETTRAAGFAVTEAFGQAGITEKEWLAVQDDRTRDTHADMDGQRQPVSEPFQSPGGATAMYPGDFGMASEDINCRCVSIAVDSLPDKAARIETWTLKASQMERIEATFSRQLRSAFREQGQQVIEVIERKGNQ